MFHPTGFADLAGRRVGVLGYGREGRATEARLRSVGAEVVVVDDDPAVGVLVTGDGGLKALATCDVVLKGPGIARRRADVASLRERVPVTSALNLWFGETDRSRVIAVTGTKGKSTTTALAVHALTCLGVRARAVGNIGQPPYDPALDAWSGYSVVEVSSYQAPEIEWAPAVVALTSLGSDHLDWHGSLDQYHADKLSLTRAAGPHVTVIADQPELVARADLLGGVVELAGPIELASALHLAGAHNDGNVGVAVAAVAALLGRARADVAAALVAGAARFVPLPGRLSVVATEDRPGGRLRYVDDGLATAPLPAVAALAVFAAEPVALIAGGHDRGVDYAPLASALAGRAAPTLVVALGPAGARIAAAVRSAAPDVAVVEADDLDQAVTRARAFLPAGGVVLLSPAAPSFDRYRNWEERSADFARAARDAGSLGRDSNP
ncbi:MAG: Mur ligase family protein [Acidimicrobiales bacterium]